MMEIKLGMNEISRLSISENKTFDPDKRIDINQRQDMKGSTGYDVDRRIDITGAKDVECIKCLNEDLAGNNHPVTEVPFEKKTVDLEGGKIEGVFPVFDSDFDIQLPEDMYLESDAKQFNECNRQLKNELQSNPSLREKFTNDQIEQIMDGETPDGKVWHHNEEMGKMQLVDFEIHDKTAHRGGKSIWGGGQECR